MCRFTLLYRNDKTLREQILGLLAQIAEQKDLSKEFIQHPLFRTFTLWPTEDELNQIPLECQCELLEYSAKTFVRVKALVIDVSSEILR